MTTTPPDIPRYELVEGWPEMPEGLSFAEVTDVKVDGEERVFVLSRNPHRVSVFDREGHYLYGWGEGRFTKPHGLFIDPAGQIWVVDAGAHAVYRFTPDGEPLTTLGTPGRPSDTGLVMNERPVQSGGGPFNMPTHLLALPSGELLVTDGYGNARVHRFSPQGELLSSWGEPGSGAGQFNLPHGIAVDAQGQLYVVDRENSRVQIFTPDGTYLDAWTWPNRPNNILIDADERVYLSESGFYTNLDCPPMFRFMTEPPPGHDKYARVTLCTTGGEVLARIGEKNAVAPGNILAPHGLALDSRGDLYVGEVPIDGGACRTYASHALPVLQKFRRIA